MKKTPFETIAAKLGISAAELLRILTEDFCRNFPGRLTVILRVARSLNIECSGIEKFLRLSRR